MDKNCGNGRNGSDRHDTPVSLPLKQVALPLGAGQPTYLGPETQRISNPISSQHKDILPV